MDAGPYSSPYRARPITWSSATSLAKGGDAGKQFAFNRNIGYVGTFFHFVAQARQAAHTPAAGIIWFGVDDASLSVRVPMYSSTASAPETWAYGNGATGEYSARSAFWAFNLVSNYASARYNLIAGEVTQKVVETEKGLMASVAVADAAAAALVKSKGQAAANAYLSNFSIATADSVVDQWVAFFPTLFVKYRDGLVCPPAPPPANPKDLPPPPNCEATGYSKKWYSRVAASSSSHFLLPDQAGADADINAHAKTKLALLRKR